MDVLDAHEDGPFLSWLAPRRTVEELLEAEVADGLGPGCYERVDDEGQGYRNGHRRRRPVKAS